MIYENRSSKMKIFVSESLFFRNFYSKMALKMNLRIITKKHAADPELGFRKRSVLKPYEPTSPCPQLESE